MLERSTPILRMACLILGGLLVFQLAQLATRKDPLKGVKVPTLAMAKAPAAAEAPAGNAAAPPTNALSPSTVSLSTNASPKLANPPGPAQPGAGADAQPPLPGPVQARVEHIAQSEVLGAVPRPPVIQAGLMGIAGREAFIRTPSGQTSLLREGEEANGIKLLQIGTNRVVIEEDGRKKELIMFSGLGSETLLPKGKDNPQ